MNTLKALLTWLGEDTRFWATWLFVVLEGFAVASVPSVLLRRRGSPNAALAWLFGLFAAPFFGVLFWWLLGWKRIERKRRKQAQKRRAFIEQRRPLGPPRGDMGHLLPERAQGECVFGTAQNEVALLLDGERAFAGLEAAILEAKTSLYLFFYIWKDDETGRRLADLLVTRAKEGVSVLVLVDGFGSQSSARSLERRFRGTGVRFAVFSPLKLFPPNIPRLNFINHRKLVVIDAKVALTGGINIADEYRYVWRDLLMRIDGRAALGLAQLFLEDWYYATDEALPDPDEPVFEKTGEADVAVVASGPDTEPWIHDAFFVLTTRAERRLWLCTPYFIPTAALVMALRTAAGRGVDVRVLVPEKSDVPLVRLASRSYYRALLAAGVRIFEYQGAMLHAKALLVDDELLGVGSANLDSRSFGLSFEVTTFARCPRSAAELAAYLGTLEANASEMTRAALARQTTWDKLKESAAHLLSPLL